MNVDDLLKDLRGNYWYPFRLKLTDEDEQDYSPPFRGKRWLLLAFCYMATIHIDKMIQRIEERRNTIIEIERIKIPQQTLEV